MSSPVAKFLVTLLGGLATLAGQAISWGLVPAADKGWVSLIVGVLTLTGTAIGVYFVPNATSAARKTIVNYSDPPTVPPAPPASAV